MTSQIDKSELQRNSNEISSDQAEILALKQRIEDNDDRNGDYFSKLITIYKSKIVSARSSCDLCAEEKIIYELAKLYFYQAEKLKQSNSEEINQEVLRNLAQSFVYYRQDLYLLILLCEREKQIEIFRKLGDISLLMKDDIIAEHYYLEFVRLTEVIGDKMAQFEAYNYLGNFYFQQMNDTQAITYYKKLFSIALEFNQKLNIADIYYNLSNIYYRNKNMKLAFEYIYQCKCILKQLNEKGSSLSRCYKTLAKYWYEIDNKRVATFYTKLNEALENDVEITELIEGDDEKLHELEAYKLLGQMYFEANQACDALDYFEKALNLSIELNRKSDEMQICYQLGVLTRSLLSPDHITYFKRSLRIACEINCVTEQLKLTHILAQIYEQKSEYIEALHYFKSYYGLCIRLRQDVDAEQCKSKIICLRRIQGLPRLNSVKFAQEYLFQRI